MQRTGRDEKRGATCTGLAFAFTIWATVLGNVRIGSQSVLAVCTLVALTACPGGGSQAGGSGGPPPYPTDFTPPPALEDPPPPDPGALGHDYIVDIAPRFQDRWVGFLENCRLRLPPSHALNQSTLAVTISLAVDPAGKPQDIAIVVSSGNKEFDDVALEVASDTGVLPTPPEGLLSDDDLLHVSWQFARDRRQAGPAGAVIAQERWELERAVPKLLASGRVREAARRVAASAQGNGAEATAPYADLVAEAAVVVALRSDDLAARRFGVRAAQAGNVRAALPTLRMFATTAPDLELRRDALGALGALGDSESLPLLAAVVRGDNGVDRSQRRAAAMAMAQLDGGEQAWEILAPAVADPAQRVAALELLASAPSEASVPELIALLGAGNKRDVRVAAAGALGAAVAIVGHKAAKPLTAGLSERDGAVRAACATALGVAASRGYEGKVAFWAVVKLLKDRDERVRAAAARAGAVLGRAAFVREMYRLRKETSTTVLTAFAEGLAWVPGDEAFSKLASLASSQEADIRVAAVHALAARSEPGAKSLLASWVGDPNADVRMVAIRSLDDADVLRGLLADDEPKVRAAALVALVQRLGRMAALPDAVGALVAATTDSQRAAIAGAWLSTR